jgi:hypothetical protein
VVITAFGALWLVGTGARPLGDDLACFATLMVMEQRAEPITYETATPEQLAWSYPAVITATRGMSSTLMCTGRHTPARGGWPVS